MKRYTLLVLAIICLFLTGCNQLTSTSAASTTTRQNATHNYFEVDPSQNSEYNATIDAYNNFLDGKIFAIKENNTLAVNDLINLNGKNGIDNFAIFDVNGDGIPELHIRSMNYHIFSYQNNQVVHWYQESTSLMEGSVYPLQNGAIFAFTDTTGKMYHYTTFDANGTAHTLTFFDAESDAPNAPYSFGNDNVSKEQFDNLSKEYIKLSKNKAPIVWHAYKSN